MNKLPTLQIYRIRETHEELSKLLRFDEAQSLGIGEVFAPFARVAALQVWRVCGTIWQPSFNLPAAPPLLAHPAYPCSHCQVSEFTSGAWISAKEEYQRRMAPIEQVRGWIRSSYQDMHVFNRLFHHSLSDTSPLAAPRQ